MQVYEGAYAIARPQIEAGRIKPIMLTNSVRAPMLPTFPLPPKPVFPSLRWTASWGFLVRREMPLELRERIAQDVRAVTDASVESRLIATGQIVNIGGPSEFAAATDQQRARLAQVAKDLGIKPSQ